MDYLFVGFTVCCLFCGVVLGLVVGDGVGVRACMLVCVCGHVSVLLG